MILKTEAIVLKTYDLRETSKIAVFYSKEYGKVKGVLKGIRKDHKKFGSTVDKFSVNDIVYYQYRNSDLHLVSQCDLKQYFFPIREDLKKSLASAYILELVDKIMPTEEGNPEVYQLMMDFFLTMEKTKDVNKLVHLFQIKILTLSGFKPYLDCCLQCEKKIHGRARFSLPKGGLVCLDCQVNDQSVHPISQGTVSTLLFVERNNWTKCLRLGLPKTVQHELRYILNNFLVFHLGQKIKSAKFVAL